MLPTVKLKFGELHYVLREELDAVLAEPFPPEWTEVLGQLQDRERRRRKPRRRRLDRPKQF